VTSILFDPDVTDEERRAHLYSGQVLVYGSSPASLALVQHARDLIAETFDPTDPETAQDDVPVAEFAASQRISEYVALAYEGLPADG